MSTPTPPPGPAFDPAHPDWCPQDSGCALPVGHDGDCDLTAALDPIPAAGAGRVGSGEPTEEADDLRAIEQRATLQAPALDEPDVQHRRWHDAQHQLRRRDVPALIAEVRQLRAQREAVLAIVAAASSYSGIVRDVIHAEQIRDALRVDHA